MFHFLNGSRRPALLASAIAVAMICSCLAPALAAGGVIGNLTGTVVDASTAKAIADVAVTAASPSGSYRATTDAAGHFTFLGLPSDSYSVSFRKEGYTPYTVAGAQVFGDETNSVGVVKLRETLRTIVRVTARARNGAFQPTQTQDVTTLSGQRITQALGSATSQNETNLILAAPGTELDQYGDISIRGSLNVELGYQYDGVNFAVPFFDSSGSYGLLQSAANPVSGGYLNNITGGSGGSLQVVSGAGDATQGNIGAGVINIVPPRGTYPQKGLVGFTVGSPYYQHQADFNYGFATPNGRFSDYFSFDGSRVVPQYAPFGVDASTIATALFPTGAYGGPINNLGPVTGASYIAHDDIVNNMVYRFGHRSNQSVQFLFRTADTQTLGNYGGVAGQVYYPYSSALSFYWPFFPGGQQQMASVIPLFAGVPSANVRPTQPELIDTEPLHFAKVGYTWNINPATFLNAYYDNFLENSIGTNYISNSTAPQFTSQGGQIVGYGLDLTHQFGPKHTVTLALKYDENLPVWYRAGAAGSFSTLLPLVLNAGNANGNINSPSVDDWYLPANTAEQVGPNNPCIGPNGSDPKGCYVYENLFAQGLWTGSLPRIPAGGTDYHHTVFHESGIGLRDQWAASDKLHLDYGVRMDIDKLDWGRNPFNPDLADPTDVSPSAIGNTFLFPHVLQPRFAAAYQVGANDALRFSYGRSVEFFFGQTAGTPYNIANIDPLLYNVPVKNFPGGNPACGSGANLSRNTPGHLFPCTSYVQSLFWLGDQLLDAPDLGGGSPPTYNNWDLGWSHEFTKGAFRAWGMKLTGFMRRGYNVEENTLLANGPPNPVTGQTTALTFAVESNGVEKTSGYEFMLTTPDRPVGLSGFLTMTYVSEFSSNPPTDTSQANGPSGFPTDQLPILNAYEFNTGQLYRNGFLPPFQGRLGLEYRMKDGIKINPILSFDTGFPTGVGYDTYGGVNGGYLWIPETNFGTATPLGGPNGPGNPYNSSYYVDPANPGSYLNPNIAASRGYDEPALPGGKLTNPHAYLDLDLEYSPPSSAYTFGVYVGNVFNNHYGLWYPNTAWQPVATGIGGPQTGKFAGAYPGSLFYNGGARDAFAPTFGQTLPFVVPYNAGTTYQFYLQKRL